jgi:hypothetical protein
LIGPSLKKKKNETMEAPQIEGSILKYGVPPLGPTFAKAYRIKVRVLWRTCWGTHWEPQKLIGNFKGT